jgi:hypothetical protein
MLLMDGHARRNPTTNPEISLYFSLLTGILTGDGFAGDCVLRQTVCSSENCSLIRHETPALRAFSRVNEPEMSIETTLQAEFWGSFL